MSNSGNKASTSHPPLPASRGLASPKSPQPPKISREPHIVRTNSQSKASKNISSEKVLRTNEMQKNLKYSKPLRMESHPQSSIANSQTHPTSAFFQMPFEDSQETIQKMKSYSREKSIRGKGFRNHLKGEVSEALDMLSGVSGSKSTKRSTIEKGEDYYLYWKNKAHEYLDSNMKLMEDIRRLTRENEELKERVDKMDKKASPLKQEPKAASDQEVNKELRKISLHYLGKIEGMEKELKKKEITIESYQAKITELSNKLAGDGERIKLMNRMKEQIDRLQLEPLQRQTQQSFNSLQVATTNSMGSNILTPQRTTATGLSYRSPHK